jgi:hypothetical protein
MPCTWAGKVTSDRKFSSLTLLSVLAWVRTYALCVANSKPAPQSRCRPSDHFLDSVGLS